MRTWITLVGLVYCVGAEVAGQEVSPPPGFTPAPEGAPLPPEAGIVTDPGGSPRPARLPFLNDISDIHEGEPLPGAPGSGAPDLGPGMPQGTTLFGNGAPPYTPMPVLQPPVLSYPRLWITAEALYWWTKASPVPAPLVTIGDPGDPIPGALGQPGTGVLLGGQDVRLPGRPGGRFTLGFTIDPEQIWGFEASYLFLENSSVTQGVFSDGGPNSATLAFPFFNPNTPGEDATFLALPGAFSGTANLTLQSFFQGAEANVMYNLRSGNAVRWDLLGGFRWLNVQEQLNFSTDSPDLGTFDVFHTFDNFRTSNNFYGGQLGLRAGYENPRLFLNATGKLALGGTIETVQTSGGTFISNSNGTFAFPGAYLTQPTNIGTASVGQFAVVPEVDLNCGIRLSPWASIVVGYSFLYLSSVARPGDQIDRVINPTQAPAITGNPPALAGPARPMLSVHDTDFWVQGLNFTLQLRY